MCTFARAAASLGSPSRENTPRSLWLCLRLRWARLHSAITTHASASFDPRPPTASASHLGPTAALPPRRCPPAAPATREAAAMTTAARRFASAAPARAAASPAVAALPGPLPPRRVAASRRRGLRRPGRHQSARVRRPDAPAATFAPWRAVGCRLARNQTLLGQALFPSPPLRWQPRPAAAAVRARRWTGSASQTGVPRCAAAAMRARRGELRCAQTRLRCLDRIHEGMQPQRLRAAIPGKHSWRETAQRRSHTQAPRRAYSSRSSREAAGRASVA